MKGGYGVVYQEIMKNPDISIEAKAIYAYLSSITGKDKDCFPSVETICRDLNISRNRLQKHLNQLVECGVVRKTRDYNKNLKSRNHYEIIVHNRALENKAIENKAIENKALENKATTNNNITNNNITNIKSPELKAQDNKPVISLILNTKDFYDVYKENIEEWKELYPAVDVMQELRKMKGWLDSNPSRRKTKRGISRFINSWLARSQDKGGSVKTDKGGEQDKNSGDDQDRRPASDLYRNLLGFSESDWNKRTQNGKDVAGPFN